MSNLFAFPVKRKSNTCLESPDMTELASSTKPPELQLFKVK